MRIFIFLFFFLTISCSFDDKSGIWKNENEISKTEKKIFEGFETFKSEKKIFEENIRLRDNFTFASISQIENNDWRDEFYSASNNLVNFKYKNLNKLRFKGKKISRSKLNNKFLLYKNLIFSGDEKGNIIIFSLTEKKIIQKYNFYKKRYKNFKKKINLIIEKDIVYVSDNIGYVYAYNYLNNNLIWAKNFKVPNRSNLKLFNEKLVLADENNKLLILNKIDGKLVRQIPTEETVVKNKFSNNISLGDKNLFFLNTYGSLYSISKNDLKINWFVNFNQSGDLNPSNLFNATEILNYKNLIVICTDYLFYIIDSNSGQVFFKNNISAFTKPIVVEDYLFLISKNKFLIAIDLKKQEIIYSHNIEEEVADFLKTKKKLISLKNFILADNKLMVILRNSYLINFNINGKIESIRKLRSKINTDPIFANSSLIYFDHSNKLSILD